MNGPRRQIRTSRRGQQGRSASSTMARTPRKAHSKPRPGDAGRPRLILLNKPYRVLPQFTDGQGRATLAGFGLPPGVYPAGRLDYDSEGLMVLTDYGPWQVRISHPRHKMVKTYWVQVEGRPDAEALACLRRGVILKDGPARALSVRVIGEPAGLWTRHPPIRYRAHIPTTWLELRLDEGRNRLVRRMTATIGHPTLRLVRQAVGPWTVDALAPGQWREVPFEEAVSRLGRGRAGGRSRPPANGIRRRPPRG